MDLSLSVCWLYVSTLRVCAGEIQTVWCTDFSSMLFFGLIWWKVAKKWLLTHPQGIWTWKWGRFGLYSKTWILRPDWWGSAFSSFPCLPVGRKFLLLHQGDLLIPLEYPIEEKKNFFSKNVVFWFFQKNSNFSSNWRRDPGNWKFS